MKLHARPLLPFVLAYIAGVLCASAASSHETATMICGLLLGLCAYLIPWRSRQFPVLALLLCVFAIGLARSIIALRTDGRDASRLAEGKLVHVTGVIVSDVEPIESGGCRFVLAPSRVRTYTGGYDVTGGIMVTARPSPYSDAPVDRPPGCGDRVSIHGRLRIPDTPRNPGAMDYRAYLARRGIRSTLSTRTEEVSVVATESRGPVWFGASINHRIAAVAGRLFAGVHVSLLLGILLGSYASLPLGLQSAFMSTGTMHVLAASGYNCGIVVGIVNRVLRWLTVPGAYAGAFCIGALWLFVLVAGSGPSVVRAGVMLSAYLAAFLLKRTADMLNTMLLAGLALLALNPLNLFDIGFQLSFAAVLVVVLAMPIVERCRALRLPSPGRQSGSATRLLFWFANTIATACLASFVICLGTWPILAYYFNYLSTVAVIANALTALLVVALTVAGIIALTVGAICPPLGHLLAQPAILISKAMIGVVSGLADCTWASVSVCSPPGWAIGLYYLIFMMGLEYAHRKLPQSPGPTGTGDPAGHHGDDLVVGAQAR